MRAWAIDAKVLKRIWAGVAASAVLVFEAGPASATMINVTATVDDTTVNGNCTLREALIAANTNAAVDACPAGSSVDVIDVPGGTYVLTLTGAGDDTAATGDLDITSGTTTINGAGVGATVIDGNLTDRVIDVDPASVGVTAILNGLTITNGVAPVAASASVGGGVRSAGTLTVTNALITGNRAGGAVVGEGGGIASSGSLSIADSAVCDNVASTIGAFVPPVNASGGGISSSGSLQVVDTTICDNSALGELAMSFLEAIASGGGLASSGTPATITRTTISGNLALGGGMFTVAFAGGVALAADATFSNCTITNNDSFPLVASSASGISTSAPVTVTLGNGTVSHNSGGIGGTGSTLVLRNTIVANNASGDCRGVLTVTANAYNIDSDSSCTLSGTDLPGVDPLLDALQNNGGPTFTRALLAGSPALDAGNPAAPGGGGTTCETMDQRGIVRPQNVACDIGAFELSTCGDGIIDPPETCDDGGTAAGDGCSAACQVETCYQCSSAPSTCNPDTGAACDDGDACTNGETCSSLAVCGGGVSTCMLDHYKCYQGIDLKNPKFVKTTAALSDQLTNETVDVQKLTFVCTPVDKNGEGIINPSAHLACYQIRGENLTPRPRVEVSTQFQASRFEVKKPKLLCVPATKTLLP